MIFFFYEAVKETLESFNGNGKIKIGKYKCVWTNKTTGERFIVDNKWCELKYGPITEYMGSKLGKKTSLKHKKAYYGAGHERTWPKSYYNTSHNNNNSVYNSILDDIIKRRRLGFFDFLGDVGGFFKDIGEGIVNAADAAARAVVDAVEWVSDLVDELGELGKIIDAIESFVDLVIQLLKGEIDQSFGISYKIYLKIIFKKATTEFFDFLFILLFCSKHFPGNFEPCEC